MAIQVHTVTMNDGMFFENCQIVWCDAGLEAIVVDPGAWRPQDVQAIVSAIDNTGANVVAIVNTHGHLDHIAANSTLKSRFQAPIWIHAADANMLTDANANGSSLFGLQVSSPPADRLLEDGEVIPLGKSQLTVIATPGHTQGCICLLGDNQLISGDTLFQGGVGRTDLPGGCATTIIESIRSKLLTLPGTTCVYPGHGPSTTIDQEKRGNPFLFS